MNYQAWIDPRIRQVSVAQVKRYMEAHGWELVPFPRPELLVFEHPRSDNAPVRLILPASETMDDYHNRLVDLLGSLGIYEDRYAVEILNEMLRVDDTNGVAAHPVADHAETSGK